mmetsp:Transcript_94419/g.224911  ORF Transcript_94419/g.224911 Transcript_94419/m.224911 type:complete len:391 (+) Transcript_94419:125-1297(+)
MGRSLAAALLLLFYRPCGGVGLKGKATATLSLSQRASTSVDYFNPTFAAPQLTPKQFLIISSPVEQKIVYAELKNFKSTTGRTFALVDSGLNSPRDLAFDGERGALYVADSGAKKIYRYHVYVKDNGASLGLITDGVQLCIMQNADVSWVNVDLNGDVFYSDATAKTINRIPVDVIDMLSKGQYSSSDLVLLSEKSLESGGGAAPESGSHFVYSVYQGSVNPHVSTPGGLVSDGARIYWTNQAEGKTAGSIVEGEVAPKLPKAKAGEPAATAFPSRVLTNETDAGYGVTKSNKYMFYAADKNGIGVVSGVTEGGATFDFISGLAAPRGLTWDGDQTIFVADEAAGVVYSFPGGRLMSGAPFTKSAVLHGAFGLSVFSEHDKAWPMQPFRG